jgi:putative phosphoesterase
MNEAGVRMVLHTGDYVAPFVIPVFEQLNADLIGVFGNNDGDRTLLLERCRNYEHIEIRGNFVEIDIEGLEIGLIHGHEKTLKDSLIAGGYYDAFVYGHTHIPEISRIGKTLVINPGEVCGYVTGTSTLAILDFKNMQAQICGL